mmetsp:Transcript_9393/g.12446  ORF Transcript_9393/g.12446 Transcript_9393/m.12446 type:complete len:175 (+) Transcript_9393:62-586(+)|eukprot:CAMPEP_0198152828 /NCGR_PEP_ID=MMETSP1443-20131203/61504_1 /TAXON_ID=186043 /ORGANISM="Entomoneis sp., Strain CCMP2396" /LENGTH=174 /DNA_ID=CAMNT_0043818961 /DNA_START=39 /DNA_END=563 /DNA_ORIENTATION=+
MKITVATFLLSALSLVNALAPPSSNANKANHQVLLKDLQKASAGAFAAATIAASTVLTQVPAPADAVSFLQTPASNLVAAKETRQGLYQDYEIDVPDQVYDDARSTFKSAKETKSNKGKYTALLAILIVGSFIIPMAQYFWYVRDDDSTDQFFGAQKQAAPEPVEPPKKKGWFN